MHKKFLVFGAFSAGLAVLLGAFGAHSLKSWIPADALQSYQTGVQYQFYHSFAILILGLLTRQHNTDIHKWAGIMFMMGISLFSGSLYLLTFTKAASDLDAKWLPMLTPLGGVCFMIGWTMFAIAAGRHYGGTTHSRSHHSRRHRAKSSFEEIEEP